MDYYLTLKWQKSKQLIHERDGIFNTKVWKPMVFEMLLCFIMNYPSLYGHYYTERANEFEEYIIGMNYPDTVQVIYNTNDLLLCIMILCRIHFLLRAAINLSEHKQPRA